MMLDMRRTRRVRAGDVVTIAAPSPGALVNRVDYAGAIEPWTFGAGALMRNLAGPGAPGQGSNFTPPAAGS